MSVTMTLTPEQVERLKEWVNDGWDLKEIPHAHFSAKKRDVSLTLYFSGKLVIQGKGTDEFIEMVLEPEILQALIPVVDHDPVWRIGVDEAGKGDYFGPLVIAGVSAGEERLAALVRAGVRDSKTLTDPQVMKIAQEIRKIARYSLVVIDPPKYNELYLKFGNLNHMLAWGHAQAIKALWQEEHVQLARIDQFAAPWVVESALKKQGVTLRLEQKTKGESDPVVAAASILARAGFLEGIHRSSLVAQWTLPKGAGAPVLEAARQLVKARGKEILMQVAKVHFKTTLLVTAPDA
ncbi:MAG: ribonuclease HIII [Chlamydiia bacterium]